MKKRQPTLGSQEWLTTLLQDPAARDVRGRSRPTQRYVVQDARGRPDYAEGGNCAVAHSILTAMTYAGFVDRVKLEPFRLTEREHGVNAVPDILFTMKNGRVFVAETKSSRYLTEEKLQACEKVQNIVNAANMTYLFWTDKWPLEPACWRVMRRLRRCGTADVPQEQVRAAIETVQERPRTFAELRGEGVYMEAILAAVWSGQLHIDLFNELTDETLVTADVRTRRFHELLTAPVRSHGWWASQPRA